MAGGVCGYLLANRLQRLPFGTPLVVTLNPRACTASMSAFLFDHPIFDAATIPRAGCSARIAGRGHVARADCVDALRLSRRQPALGGARWRDALFISISPPRWCTSVRGRHSIASARLFCPRLDVNDPCTSWHDCHQ